MENAQIIDIGDGVALSVIDCGAGDPIVFISGLTFSSDVFEHQIAPLAEKNRVLLVEPRSHGRSPQILEGNNYPQHGHDLARLFAKLDLQNINLAGWSFGALSAWSYIDYAGLDRVKKFICIDCPPKILSTGEAQGDWVEAPLDEIATLYHGLLDFDNYKSFISNYTQEIMLQRDLQPQEAAHFLAAPLQTPLPIVRDLFVSGAFSNYLELAKKIDKERASLFFIAEHWANIAVPYLKKHLPKAQIEVFGNHMMFWEYPERFNKIVQTFLAA